MIDGRMPRTGGVSRGPPANNSSSSSNGRPVRDWIRFRGGIKSNEPKLEIDNWIAAGRASKHANRLVPPVPGADPIAHARRECTRASINIVASDTGGSRAVCPSVYAPSPLFSPPRECSLPSFLAFFVFRGKIVSVGDFVENLSSMAILFSCSKRESSSCVISSDREWIDLWEVFCRDA